MYLDMEKFFEREYSPKFARHNERIQHHHGTQLNLHEVLKPICKSRLWLGETARQIK